MKQGMKRTCSLFLVMIMVLSMVIGYPLKATATESVDSAKTGAEQLQQEMTADSVTYLDWEKSFGKQDAKGSTTDAGRIWTNKSVWNSDASVAGGTQIIKRSSADNFLVGLSTIASNKEIVGEAAIPVDVVFVLDMSGSMADNDRIEPMVDALNEAMTSLLSDKSLHKDNRVGIVTYNKTPQQLLPLDTYHFKDGSRSGEFVEFLKNGGGRNSTIRTSKNLQSSDNKDLASTELGVSSGTYVQQGIKMGGEMLLNSNEKDIEGVKRIPIMIVMSDGAASWSNEDYINLTGYEHEDSGGGSYLRDTITAFLTTLTGQYYKDSITEAYDREALVYTLGLSVARTDVASLDPTGLESSNTHYSTLNNLWSNFAKTSNGSRYYTLNSNRFYRHESTLQTNKYNDKYFAALDGDLSNAFREIVDEIMIQSRYYPTDNNTGGSPNLSGYVTFEDEIPAYMEVKKMNGLLMDNNFQTGRTFAIGATNQGDSMYRFGTMDSPTAIGNEFIRSIAYRVDFEDNSQIKALMEFAYSEGQIAYKSQNDYSNYIAWYSEGDKKYVGPAKNDKSNREDYPTATKFNRSYFYLSEMRVQKNETSLMYMTIRVEEDLTTGAQKVIYQIPSTLVPLVMYNVTVNDGSLEGATETKIARTGAYPARLFYEVGLKDEINEFNVKKIVGDKYPHIIEDGKVYFYSNAWDAGEKGKTTATFSPNIHNEYYYFPKNTTIYADPEGKVPLTEEPTPGNSYYYQKNVFDVDNSVDDGDIEQKSNIRHEMVEISPRTLFEFKDSHGEATYAKNEDTNQYYMKIGTPKDSLTYKAEEKSGNQTETATHSIYPEIIPIYNNEKVDIEVSHGNNGRFYIQQESGVMVEKLFSTENKNDGTQKDFAFTAALESTEALSEVEAAFFDKDGERSDKSLQVADNKVNFTLKEQEKVYLILPTGVKYTITEDELQKDYFLTEVIGSTGVTIENNAAFGTVKNAVMDEATFVNEYKESIEFNIGTEIDALKTLYGRAFLSTDDFNFTITEEKNGAAVEVAKGQMTGDAIKNDDGSYSKKIKFDKNLSFTEPGEYLYTIREIAPKTSENSPITYSTDEYQLKLVVGKNASGELEITQKALSKNNVPVAGATPKAEFVNTYSAEDLVIDNLTVKKNLVGRDWLETDAFNFAMTVEDEATNKAIADKKVVLGTTEVTVTEKTEKEATFGNITFKEAGTYKFVVRETSVAKPNDGMTYDTAPRYVTIKVKDDYATGKLVLDGDIQISGYDDGLTFTNSYKPSEATINGLAKLNFTKVLTGREWTDDDTFKFEIKAVTEDAPLPASKVVEVKNTEADEAEKPFNFGDITFTDDDMKDAEVINGVKTKTFEYRVFEVVTVADGTKGMTYDRTPAKVMITVTDDGTGTLKADVSINKTKFTNEYKSLLSYEAAAGLDIVKILTGRDMQAGQFQFVIEAKDEASALKAGIDEGLEMTVTNTAADDGKASVMMPFVNMKFTQSDDGKDYTYTIKEVIKTAAGYTYDDAEQTVVISVKDEKNGKIIVTTKVTKKDETKIYDNGERAKVNFNNRYEAKATTVQIGAVKTLTGRALKDGEFKFNITNAKDSKVVIATGVNDKDGKIDFGKIEYTTELLKKDLEKGLAVKDSEGSYVYQYTVSEETDGLADKGITAEQSVFNITVTVKDDGEGKLTATVNYPEEAKQLEFINRYNTDEATVGINGTKKLVIKGDNPQITIKDITDKFAFSITGIDEDGEKAPLPKNAEVTNDANGNIDFGKINYTLDDLNGEQEKVYTYTIKEKGTVSGITNDSKAKIIKVKVADDGKGHLTAELDSKEATFEFTNTYTMTPTDSNLTDSFTIQKLLTGREMNAGEFKFVLKDIQGKVVSTGINDAKGNVKMSDINFDEAGTYQYTLSEDKAGTTEGGVTYDESVYAVTATVKDNKDGTLKAEWSIGGLEGKKVTFENKYEAKPTAVQIGAVKTLTGRALRDGEFIFELRDEIQALQTKTNDAQGSVTFDSIRFTEAGTYEYTIREVQGTDKDITYDKTEYQVAVEVKDDGKGQLEATTTITNEGILADAVVFANKYTKPEEPDDPNKPTDPDNPDDPNNPTDPDNPDDPNKPDKPTGPEDPTTPTVPETPTPPTDVPDKNDDGTPKTGDESNLAGYGTIMAGSALAILLMLAKKRKDTVRK